jgi:predicted nucleic acid-binding protein
MDSRGDCIFTTSRARAYLVQLGLVQLGLVLDTDTLTDLPRIRALLEKYSDLPADFADASLVALCERRRITTVASVDSDFTVYRMQDRRGLRNLFYSL